MEDFTEETNMEDFTVETMIANFTPPETLTIEVQEEETVEDPEDEEINFIQAKSRFIGLRFWYGEYQYLYKYPDKFDGKEGDEIALFDKRIYGDRSGKDSRLSENEIRIVEVIKVDKRYVFCTLLDYWNYDIEYWVAKNFQRVAIKLYNAVKTVRVKYDVNDGMSDYNIKDSILAN